MKNATILSLIIFATISGLAQNECGTNQFETFILSQQKTETEFLPPWYGNNQYLTDLLDAELFLKTKKDSKTLGCTDDIKYLVPIDVISWYDDNGGNEPMTRNYFYNVLQNVNAKYRNTNTGIQFYIRKYYTGNSTLYNSNLSTDFELLSMFMTHSSEHAIVVNLVKEEDLGVRGSASQPHLPYPYHLFIKSYSASTLINDAYLAGTLAHELGHTLGLKHTHDGGRSLEKSNGDISMDCYQESVDRNYKNPLSCVFTSNELSCEVNGDFLSDTPADPNLSGNVLLGCTLNLPSSGDYHHDNWGDTWTPDIFNIMSYSLRECKTRFSNMQIAVMWHWLSNDFFKTRPNIAKITGNKFICTNILTTFYAPTLEFATYNWTLSGNLTKVSQSGNSITVKGNRNGDASLSVAISNPYSNFCIETNDIKIGTQTPAILLCPVGQSPTLGAHVEYGYVNEDYYLYAYGENLSNVDTDYRWKFYSNNPNELPVLGQGRQIEFSKSTSGNYEVSLQYNGQCGWSIETFKTIRIEDNLLLNIYPNPFTDNLTIEITSTETRNHTHESALNHETQQFSIQFRHVDSGYARTVEMHELQKQVSMQGLPSGMYIALLIHNGKIVQKTTIMKNKPTIKL